ncbi:MAG: endonuclease/exonuclease/phosphatase family protein [Sedimentisphaerales bacterium]|nr:endonuclease/exonuclease/phosphatase family protein [Sedimentisphaerales bacterium]
MKSRKIFRIVIRNVVLICIVLFAGCNRSIQSIAEPPQLRVLTYNIHHGEAMDGQFDYTRLAKVITDLHPDIVALQEVDNATQRAGGVDQARRLGKVCKMNYAFGQAMPYQGGQYGEAILSRFAMDNVTVHPLPYHPGQEPRAALAAAIRPGNGLPDFVFVGTHLCHQNNDTRTEQTTRLSQLFPASGGMPILMAGDFNARPDSDPMKVLFDKGWIDTVAPRSKIDYVLLRPDDPWKVIEVTIVDEPVVSDHDPILVILQWQGK